MSTRLYVYMFLHFSNEYYGLLECNVNDFFTDLMPGLWTGLISDTERNVAELAYTVHYITVSTITLKQEEWYYLKVVTIWTCQ